MSTKSDLKKSNQPPLDIARETFKQMATKRVVPTPDNYEQIYNELAGIEAKETLDNAIKKALLKLPHETAEQAKWLAAWNKMLTHKKWDSLPELLSEGMDLSVNFSTQWPEAIRELLKSWDAKQAGLDINKKRETLERVLIKFGNDPTLAQKLQNMAKSWMEYARQDGASAIELVDAPVDSSALNSIDLVDADIGLTNNNQALKMDNGVFNKTPDPFQQSFISLQEAFKQSLKHGFIPRLDGYPELQDSAAEIYTLADKAKKVAQWQELVTQFRALLVKVELVGANEEAIKNDLLRLLKLLVDNISELVSDDQWLRGQIAVVQTIISSPLERKTMTEAEKSIKEVIQKQGLLKHSLSEAKSSFKSMVTTFVDRLGYMSDSTGSYEHVVEEFAREITKTDDIPTINRLLEKLMHETHTMQADIVRSRDDLLQQQALVEAAQAKIKNLETELASMSEKVRIDQLTGVLNRRGMNEVFAQEIARVERGGGQFSIALLDIDNFKRLNDNYGHDIGDAALKHLANVVTQTVRPTDIVTRFGGEEFVIILPNTDIEQALASIVRLQRALTKKFFMGNNEQLLITFSAGVALYQSGEEQASVLHRADQAMYLAKKTGKNKTMTEHDLLDSSNFLNEKNI